MENNIMKKLIYVITLLAAISFASLSASAMERMYGEAGCGLGSVLMGADGNQISAGTTNGLGYNQLFGITTGTINCIDSASSSMAGNVDNFIRGNQAALATDVSRGQGETLSALGDVMGCSDKAALGQKLKQNYSKIFTNDSTMKMTDSVITIIQKDQSLKSQCTAITNLI